MSDAISEKPFPERKPLDGPNPQTPRRGKGLLQRYLLPAILLVLVVGGIAWVTQYMATWRTKTTPPAPVQAEPYLDSPLAKRDNEILAHYLPEVEKGGQGHYDFPLRNPSPTDTVEVGLKKISCQCSEFEVCFVSEEEVVRYLKVYSGVEPWSAKEGAWTWHSLSVSAEKGLAIPPQSLMLARVKWIGRKDPPDRLEIKADLWMQPVGKARQFISLRVDVRIVTPVRVVPDKVNVGRLALDDSAKAEFTVWSSTRDKLDLKVAAKTDDPLFTVTSNTLNKKEIADFQEMLDKAYPKSFFLVRSAVRVDASIHSRKDGQQLDQGAFYREVRLLLDNEALPNSPLVMGGVKGDIDVGAGDDRGKVNLGAYSVKEGKKVSVPMSTSDKINLEHVGQEPSTLAVKLLKKGTRGNRTEWQLEVEVPPNTALNDFSAIILRVSTNPPRLNRISVVGAPQS